MEINLPSLGLFAHLGDAQISEIVEYCVKGSTQEPSPYYLKPMSIIYTMNKFSLNLMVETGTFMGDTTAIINNVGKKVITVELSDDLHRRATERFAGNDRICCMHGDSTTVLPQILRDLNEPALFWLDGHYSGGTTAEGEKYSPIAEELSALAETRRKKKDIIDGSVIFIDDMRIFGISKDYPPVDTIIDFIRHNFPNHTFRIHNDCLRMEPALGRE